MNQTQRQLSTVPVPRRRQAAVVLSLFAALLAVIGILPWTAAAPTSVRVSAVAALLAAALVALIAWGLARSIRLDTERARHAEFDAMLAEAGGGCDCGHDHGAEAHVDSSPSCAAGSDDPSCHHDCAACVLSQLH